MEEQVFLAVAGAVFDIFHLMQERPRAFWAAWAAGFSVLAVVLLRTRPVSPIDGQMATK